MPMTAANLHRETSGRLAGAQRNNAEAIRYFVASLAALLVDAGLLWLNANLMNGPIWLAGGLAYLAGLVLVYLLSIRWVFKERTLHDPRSEFLVFAMRGLVGLVLNSVTLLVATGLGLALPLAKALSAGIGFIANFISRKVLLFAGRAS